MGRGDGNRGETGRTAAVRRLAAGVGVGLWLLGAPATVLCAGDRYGLAYPAEKADAVAEVNGKSLTKADLKAIGLESAGMKGHGDRAAQKRFLKELVNQELVIQYAVEKRLPEEGAAKEIVDLFLLMTLGMEHYDQVVSRGAPIAAEDLSGVVPRKWKIGDFELVLFDTLEAAENEARRIRTAADFAELKKAHPERAKVVRDLYPGSGFFAEFDDAGMFNRKAGEVFGAAETGLGAAVVLVKGIRDASPGEMSEIVSKASASLSQQEVGKEIERIRSTVKFAADRKAILEYIRAWRAGAPSDVVLCTIGERRITGRQLPWLVRNEPLRYLQGRSAEDIVPRYEAVLSNLALWVAMGEESRRNGDDQLSLGRYSTSFNYWKRGYYYSLGMDAGIGRVEVTDAEIRKYYDDHVKDKFTRIERVRAAHIYSREDRALLDNVSRRLKKGEAFEDLARQYSEDKQSAAKGGVLGWIVRDGTVLPEIEKAAFQYKIGDVTPVIKTARGYHILKLLEFKATEVVPFEKARDEIRGTLTAQKQDRKRDAFLKKLKTNARIHTYPERLNN